MVKLLIAVVLASVCAAIFWLMGKLARSRRTRNKSWILPLNIVALFLGLAAMFFFYKFLDGFNF